MKHVLEPLSIKGMKLRNRLVMPPMATNFASEDGAVTEQIVTYYRERAKGGAGLIIVEMSYIQPSGKGFPCMLGVHNDRFLPGLNELAEAIKSYGACAALQIGHAGRQTRSGISGHRILAPSAIPSKGTTEVPKELSIEEIQDIIHAFGAAALRAKSTGFDAVELHGTHGYLLNEFLSPYTNRRADAYGGSFENRLRCAVEVIQEARSRVGEDYPLIFRLCANEYLEDGEGITLEAAKKIAPRLAEAGIDILHITGGIGETRDHVVQPLYYKQGYHVHLAEGIKQSVGNIPVITAGSITDPYMADKIIEEGKADLIAVGRGLIADPMFLRKLKEGRVKEIRRCIRCNECIGRFRRGYRISCAVNPIVGKEASSELRPAEKPKRVLIVGAGPAGMEAARILSLRGHEVTLCEKGDEPGGYLRISSLPPWKKDILTLVDWLKAELERSSVAIHLNTEVTPEYIAQLSPDVLIVATGSTPRRSNIPGIESAITAVDVLKGVPVGDSVVVCGGGLVGCEVAWYLAEFNKKVTIVEMLDEVATDMEVASRTAVLRKLREHNVEIICNLKMEKILPGEGIIGIDKELTKTEIKADTVVLAMGFDPNRALSGERNRPYEVYLIGDAKEPRRIIDAIREADHVARFEI